MLKLETNIEGTHAEFGYLRDKIGKYVFSSVDIGNKNEDFLIKTLWKENGETIYMQLL